jgi:hypothetical protein
MPLSLWLGQRPAAQVVDDPSAAAAPERLALLR